MGPCGLDLPVAQRGGGCQGTSTRVGSGQGRTSDIALRVSAPQVTVLVMCHTRELAFQISKEYERFSKYMPSVKVSPQAE